MKNWVERFAASFWVRAWVLALLVLGWGFDVRPKKGMRLKGIRETSAPSRRRVLTDTIETDIAPWYRNFYNWVGCQRS